MISLCGTGTQAGTSTISNALAAAVADSGWKTLLIEADINKNLSRRTARENQGLGLADFLLDQCEEKDIYRQTEISGLVKVPGGRSYFSPVKLFFTKKFETWHGSLRGQYDMVIYDLAPITQEPASGLIASKTDGAILVAEQRRSSKAMLMNAYKALESSHAACFGVVLNKVNKSESKRFSRNTYILRNQI